MQNLQKTSPSFQGGFGSQHRERAWLTRAGKQRKRATRQFYKASFQVRLPRARKAPGGNASEHRHLSALPSLALGSGGAGSGFCCRKPFVGSGAPPPHTQHPRFRHGQACRSTVPPHPEPAAGAALAQPRSGVRAESTALARCLHKLVFFLKVCSFSHFNPARQAAVPKDGCTNSFCLLDGGTGISRARATKLPRSPTGEG